MQVAGHEVRACRRPPAWRTSLRTDLDTIAATHTTRVAGGRNGSRGPSLSTPEFPHRTSPTGPRHTATSTSPAYKLGNGAVTLLILWWETRRRRPRGGPTSGWVRLLSPDPPFDYGQVFSMMNKLTISLRRCAA